MRRLLAALLLLIRIIFNPLDGSDFLEAAGYEVGRGIGMILSVVSGLVAFGGAVLAFKESGGSLSDLKDVNKLKSQFGAPGGGGARTTSAARRHRPAAATTSRTARSAAASTARLSRHQPWKNPGSHGPGFFH